MRIHSCSQPEEQCRSKNISHRLLNSVPLFQWCFRMPLFPCSPVSGMWVSTEQACFLCCLLLLFSSLVLVLLHDNINTGTQQLYAALSFSSYEICTLGVSPCPHIFQQLEDKPYFLYFKLTIATISNLDNSIKFR